MGGVESEGAGGGWRRSFVGKISECYSGERIPPVVRSHQNPSTLRGPSSSTGHDPPAGARSQGAVGEATGIRGPWAPRGRSRGPAPGPACRSSPSGPPPGGGGRGGTVPGEPLASWRVTNYEFEKKMFGRGFAYILKRVVELGLWLEAGHKQEGRDAWGGVIEREGTSQTGW